MGARLHRLVWLPPRIPPLLGWVRWVFIACWAAVLALTLFGGAMDLLQVETIRPNLSERYGLELDFFTDSGRLVQFPASDEAIRAGVRPGDRIEAIDGDEVTADSGAGDVLTKLGLPGAAAFSVVSADGGRHRYRLTNDPGRYAEAFRGAGISRAGQILVTTGLYITFTLVVPVALAILLMLRRSRDALAPWASLSMLFAALTVGNASYWFAGDVRWEWLQPVALPLDCWFDFAVLALFPEGRFTPRWTWAVVIGMIPLALFTALMYLRGHYSIFNAASLVGECLAVAVTVARYRAMPPGTGRQQIRWALFGFGTALATQAVGIAIFPLLSFPSTAIFLWSQVGYALVVGISNVCTMVALTFGLLRYRLYDADATISQSVSYGALTIALIAIFAGSEKIVEVLGEEYFGARLGPLAAGLGAAVAAVMVGPLHHHVTEWVERRFRSSLAHLRHGLPLLVGDMRETATPKALADTALVQIQKGVRARHGAVVLRGDVLNARDIELQAVEDWIARAALPTGERDEPECERRDPLFPLRVPLHADGAGHVGWLLLGSRPDGSFYGRQEREALQEIADPFARALAVAIERDRRELMLRSRDDHVDRELGSLRLVVQQLQKRLGWDNSAEAADGVDPKDRRLSERRSPDDV